MVTERPIVMVEDSNADFETTVMLFRDAGVQTPFIRFRTGVEALEWNEKGAGGGTLPIHILLDINLPGVTGLEVLEKVRASEWLRSVPVTMLTTSSSVSDINRSYRCGANSFLTKPVDFDRYVQILGDFANFWLRSAAAPTR